MPFTPEDQTLLATFLASQPSHKRLAQSIYKEFALRVRPPSPANSVRDSVLTCPPPRSPSTRTTRGNLGTVTTRRLGRRKSTARSTRSTARRQRQRPPTGRRRWLLLSERDEREPRRATTGVSSRTTSKWRQDRGTPRPSLGPHRRTSAAVTRPPRPATTLRRSQSAWERVAL